MFLGYRGSVNYSFNIVSAGIPHSFYARRNGRNVLAKVANGRIDVVAATNSRVARATLTGAGSAGQALTNGLVQPGLNIQFPMYTNALFQSTDPAYATLGSSIDDSNSDSVTVVLELNWPASTATNYMLNTYVAAGTDYSLYWFLNVPTLWIMSSFPTSV